MTQLQYQTDITMQNIRKKGMFFRILEKNCIIFSSFEAEQAEIVTFRQKAIEAPSIDKVDKQPLLKQIPYFLI